MPAQDTAPTPRCKDVTLAETQGFMGTNQTPKSPEMTSAPGPEICLNGVRYRWPERPVVVVCNDGGDPAYFDGTFKEEIEPTVPPFRERGFCASAKCVI